MLQDLSIGLSTLAFSTALAAPLPPQDAPAAPAAPAEAGPRTVLTIDVVGPGIWRRELRGTNLGAMYEVEAAGRLRTLGDTLLEPVRETVGPQAWRDLVALLGHHEGALRIGFVDTDASRPSFWYALEPDAERDAVVLLAGLERAFSGLAARDDVERVTTHVADHEVGSFRHPDLGALVGPFVDGGRVVVLEGARPEQALAALRDAMPAFEGPAPTRPGTAMLELRADPLALWNSGQGDWFDAREPSIAEALGVTGVEEVVCRLRTAGPRLAFEVEAGFGADGPQGIFAALFPVAPDGETAVAGWLPDGEETFKSGHVDLGQLFDTLVAVVAADNGKAVAEVRRELPEQMGIDPWGQFSDHLETGYLLVGTRFFEEEDTGGVWVQAVKPGGRFAVEKGLMTFVRRWSFGRAIPSIPDLPEGVTGYESVAPFGGDPLYFVFTEEAFLIAYGESGLERLDAILATRTRALAGRDGDTPAALRGTDRMAPAGLNGRGVLPVREGLGLVGHAFLGELVLDLRMSEFEETLREMAPLLEQHRLTHMVALTGNDGRRWRFRLLW